MACTATLTDRDTVITCERTHDGPDPTHMAEFFGAVYTWEAGAAEYRVRSILGKESTVTVTREVLRG